MAKPVAKKRRAVQHPAKSRWYGRLLLDAVAEAVLGFILFVYRFSWWTIRWTFAAVFFAAVMLAAGVLVFNRTVTGGKYVTVPNIERLSLTEATYVLADKGLEIGPPAEVESDQVPKYHVIAQRPAGSTVVRAGRKVYPTISKGPELRTAPNVISKTVDEATTVLRSAQFELGSLARIPYATQRDTVISQYPPPTVGVERGGAVHLLLSASPIGQRFLMPDLVGMPIDQAVAVLSRLNVTPAPIQVDKMEVPSDVILSQDPDPGTLVSQGQKIFYEVRRSGVVSADEVWRKVDVQYTVPDSDTPREIRVDLIDKDGVRTTQIPAQLVEGRTGISFKASYQGSLTIEFYLDGSKERSYTYEGASEPIISTYDQSTGERANASLENRSINPSI